MKISSSSDKSFVQLESESPKKVDGESAVTQKDSTAVEKSVASKQQSNFNQANGARDFYNSESFLNKINRSFNKHHTNESNNHNENSLSEIALSTEPGVDTENLPVFNPGTSTNLRPHSPLDAISGTERVQDNIVEYYFAKPGEQPEFEFEPGRFISVTPDNWNDYQKQQVEKSLAEFSKVADLQFVEVDNEEDADWVLANGDISIGKGIVGFMQGPQGNDTQLAGFDLSGNRYSREGGLDQGSYGYQLLMHEFGHGLGLGHTHDTGFDTGKLSGVESSGDFGDYNLNQGIFTVMSYNQGHPERDSGGNREFGLNGTLGALDIAALQQKYGANTDHNAGSDTYQLADESGPDTFYSTIWDTAGVDKIAYDGQRDATLDLRPATLRYETGGGGFVSAVDGVQGGLTIANGVLIENATSGNGNDSLYGNDANNSLIANAGNDVLVGHAGNDMLMAGGGIDTVDYSKETGGNGAFVSLLAQRGLDTYKNTDTLIDIENVTGTDQIDWLTGSNENNLLSSLDGNDFLNGLGGNDTLKGGMGNDVLLGGAGDDSLNGGEGSDTLQGGSGNDTVLGGAGSDVLTGGDGDDSLIGGDGDDRLNGGNGVNSLIGGLGKTIFEISGTTGQDSIADFVQGTDKIDLSAYASSGIHSLKDLVLNPGPYPAAYLQLTTFNVEGKTVRVLNMAPEQLREDDFVFA